MFDKIKWIYDVWRPFRLWVIVLIVMTLLSTVVTVSYPLVIKFVIDEVSVASQHPDASGERLNTLISVLVFIAVVRFVQAYYPMLRGYVNRLIEKHLRESLFGTILDKSLGFFHAFRTGDLLTRLTDDLSDYPRISWFCCSGLFRFLNSATRVIGCLAAMLWLNWKLAIIALIPFPIMIAIFYMIKAKLRSRIIAQRNAISETNDILEANFSGVRVIKAAAAEDSQSQALAEQLKERIEIEMKVISIFQLIHGFYSSLGVVGQVLVVAIGGIAVSRGEMTAGTFYSFYFYLDSLVEPLLDLPNLFVTARQAFVCIDRAEQIRLTDQQGIHRIFKGEHTLEAFDALTVRGANCYYPKLKVQQMETAQSTVEIDEKPPTKVLDAIELELKRGEKVAIVGRLGAGKSTLLRLISGQLEPETGAVHWNALDISQYQASGLTPKVGIVTQQPTLFSGTILENICFGRDLDENWLDQVIEASGLGAEITQFPDQLNTTLGQNGLRLSGGQRQRVAIARALYGKPELLFLDDLTSALDAENEARLWERLPKLLPTVTILTVTHRLMTARAMDRIIVLEHGEIVARGTHAELLRQSDLYKEFTEESQKSEAIAI